ncbi:polysaccharide deacetylase family protein [Leptolyngbya boryana CZ1]|uniref:Polysaccharide deacetylase family protein n=1 Tax=Leptolyngbya boryana CZ1 TaxID=3060204 RepID=A0AA96WX78_LEPBY|nr:polysaccharide deacetylase family protein [Leptolyngbya boryana]WNZ46668.1 polysaccharide deacetylase family protein [Leptolyngbya boryana CZ1]
MKQRRKPIASLSLDLDNQWSYMKTHGDEGWESFPSYLNLLIPRVLEFLDQRDLKITFFIVGQDAALEKNTAALKAIADHGHEVGNHSFLHEPWLHLYTEEQINTELAIAERHIEQATGQRPICFRGPGFSLSRTVLQVLARREYLCDASTFPTFLGPLARAYYFMTSKLSKEELEKRKQLFGKFQDGLRPLKPYRLRMDAGSLVELPVTTMPVFKVPIHASYILYLGVFSPMLAMLYFRCAIALCKLFRVQPSILLHPLDFMGCDDLPELAFFPAMNLPSYKKVAMMSKIIRVLTDNFTVLTISQHARQMAKAEDIPVMHPSAIAL